MTKTTERSLARKREILRIIEESDFLEMPSQKELAKRLGVSQQQIGKDIAVIKKHMPGRDPMLVALQIDKFVDQAIARLNELKNRADSPRSEREMILAQMSVLRQRIEIGIKLGLIKQAESPQQDNVIKIEWNRQA